MTTYMFVQNDMLDMDITNRNPTEKEEYFTQLKKKIPVYDGVDATFRRKTMKTHFCKRSH